MGIRKPAPKKTMPKRLLWIIISSCVLAAAAIATAVWIYIHINAPIKFTAYAAKDGAYSINVPDGWMVAKNDQIFQFGGGLDLGVFSNMYVPNGFNFQASGPTVGSVLTINAFDNSQKSQDNLRIYFGQIGGLSADPEKYLIEEIQKNGIKMKNVDGFYTLKHGFPVGIFRKNDLTFIMHGNITDDVGARMIEFMVDSIR